MSVLPISLDYLRVGITNEIMIFSLWGERLQLVGPVSLWRLLPNLGWYHFLDSCHLIEWISVLGWHFLDSLWALVSANLYLSSNIDFRESMIQFWKYYYLTVILIVITFKMFLNDFLWYYWICTLLRRSMWSHGELWGKDSLNPEL